MLDPEPITAAIVDSALKVHRATGPGLLESVYESILARELDRRGFEVERQKAVSFEVDGLYFEDGLRVDLLVNRTVVVEIKSVEKLAPVHWRQLITYLRLLRLPLGLLINFGAPLIKDGLHRVLNNYYPGRPL